MNTMTDSMCELEQILRQHATRYRKMQPTDAVKLIFQNEFGGGHMIQNSATCLQYLRREYDATQPDPAAALYEPIGNGIVRVHLAALPASHLQALGESFLRSAAENQGSLDSFLQKLQILRRLTHEGIFSFSSEALEAYLQPYIASGCPAVSHSDLYRQAYRPAYRVIREAFLLDPTDKI